MPSASFMNSGECKPTSAFKGWGTEYKGCNIMVGVQNIKVATSPSNG